ncbi:MAG: alpha/beta hydrolase [Holdemanella sp.]|nr:alpha/beta hydrolase [Holdemanella sp.]
MVDKFKLYFDKISEYRNIHLYLPDNYFHSEQKYPVLYMLDGHNLFYDSDATYGTCLGLKDFLDAYKKKIIVVGIEGSSDDYTRVHEFVPFDIVSMQYGPIKGRGEDTFEWIIHTVKPYIDENYRTWSHREATAFAGYSMAGITSLYSILKYNDIFSKAVVISPSVMIAKDQLVKAIDESELNWDTKVFFSWGNDEYGKEMDNQIESILYELEAHLQKKNARTYMYKHWNGQHNEASWRLQVPFWMNFLWF